ncbi:4071_t:CDS:1, partial [Acaulospora colombiana]
EISSWIDRKEIPYSSSSISYYFKLVIRGSRDGFDPQIFWNKSHEHTSTLIILKVEGSEEILGGYNPLTWYKEREGAYHTND